MIMHKTLIIAKWEFLEKVKKKFFIISMILMPLILISMGVIPSLIGNPDKEAPTPIGLLDETNEYFQAIADELNSYSLTNGQPEFIIKSINNVGEHYDLISDGDSQVLNNIIDGYVSISRDDNNELIVEYRSLSVGNFQEINKIESSINNVITKHNFSAMGVDPIKATQMISNIEIKSIKLTETGLAEETDFMQIFLTGYVFVMLLFMMILFTGGMFTRSIIEEKSNRIIELLLSSCNEKELLAGKMLGLSFLGLFQVFVWMIVAVGLLGSNLISPDIFENLWLQLIYFILGYILFTGIFVGIGSIVTTEHEAQQITGYVSIILIIPIILATQVIQSPDSTLADILTYFPLTTAPVMLLKINIYDPSLFEILSTIGLSLMSIYLIILVSSKLFRIGILSYGKRPSVSDILSWIKTK